MFGKRAGQPVGPLHERIRRDPKRGQLEWTYFAVNLEGVFPPDEVRVAACMVTKVFPYDRTSFRYTGWLGLTDQSLGMCVKFGRNDFRTLRIPVEEVTAVGLCEIDDKSTQVTFGGIYSDEEEEHLFFRERGQSGRDLVATLKQRVDDALF
jgi:hypothetical protein